MTSAGPGDEAAAGGQRLAERADRAGRRGPRRRAARAVPAPRAPSTPAPWASSTIRRAPKRSHRSQISRQRRDVALHREDAVDDDEHAAAVARRALERALELVDAVVAERRAAWRARAGSRRGSRRGRRSRRRRCRRAPRIVPSVPRLAWWPVVKTIASSVPIHSAISRSSSRCSGIVPLSRREPGQARPVASSSASCAPWTTRSSAVRPEVVVGAEHDPLGALHLDDRARAGPSSVRK